MKSNELRRVILELDPETHRAVKNLARIERRSLLSQCAVMIEADLAVRKARKAVPPVPVSV